MFDLSSLLLDVIAAAAACEAGYAYERRSTLEKFGSCLSLQKYPSIVLLM
jgi:hypothetical protein